MTATLRFPDDVPTLTDGVVTLRPHQLSDVDGAVGQGTDPDSIEWTTVPVPYGRDDAVEFITKVVPRGWEEQSDLCFAIEAEHDDGVRRFSGSASLRPHAPGFVEIAYGLHPAARGRGVCSRAVKLLLDWGFDQGGAEIVVWYANVGNWASRRVAWTNGFSFDGMIKKFLLQRGERKDGWVGTLRKTDSREPKHAWHTPPVLTTERLRLRPLVASDAERLGETYFDERSKHFYGRERSLLELTSGAAALWQIWEANVSGKRFDWCLADRETDELLGHLQIFDLEGMDETQVVPGYSTHPDARGRGLVTEALRAVTDWTFRPVSHGGLGKRRIKVIIAGSNTASRRVAEKAGYTHIGTEPQSFPIGETEFDDTAVYHRLNDNWPA